MASTREVMRQFDDCIGAGFLYGDYQFVTDAESDDFLRRGIMSCYQPVPDDTPLTVDPVRFTPEDWARLTFYSHCDKHRAFDLYSRTYLQTSGQVYWGDSQLFSSYVDNYHADLDRALGACTKGTEMITELYVPPERLPAFMEQARALLRCRRAHVIYGTVRLIEQDVETMLCWARQRFACVVFNLHVEHSPNAVAWVAETFRELIDGAIAEGGSYYLTYHRWARQDQVERCYPQMREFLAAKRRHDPRDHVIDREQALPAHPLPIRQRPKGQPTLPADVSRLVRYVSLVHRGAEADGDPSEVSAVTRRWSRRVVGCVRCDHHEQRRLG